MRASLAEERTFDGKYTIPGWWDAYLRSQQVAHKPKLFSLFVQPGSLVFDIGANRGGMTWVFRQLGARVVAVEPLHQISPIHLSREFDYQFGNDDNVVLLPVAVASTPTIELAMPIVGSPFWIITSASQRWQTKSAHSYLYRKTVRKTIEAVTLDDLIEWFGIPDFIKIDVEGFDGEVVSTLHVPVKALNMEFHKDWLWNNELAMAHLKTVGDYEYNYALDNQGDLVLPEWADGVYVISYLKGHLTSGGKGSWGDIYARLRGEQ